ncbi:MAG: FtsX-like permease family protein [Bacteroidota bacterium]
MPYLPFRFARRYLFSKKSTNAINIISGISVLGIVGGSAALILVLSVFNGFGELISGLFNAFNPDVKITAVEGKVFVANADQIRQIDALDGVLYVAKTIEENAMFEYDDQTDFGRIKGVDSIFKDVTRLDTTLIRGNYFLEDDELQYAVVGAGMEGKLGINIGDMFTPLKIYMPKRKKVGPMSDPLKRRVVRPSGVFAIQQEFDAQYIIVSLSLAQEILSYGKGEISALEVKIDPEVDLEATKSEIKAIMGEGYFVKNRFEQDEAFFKIMNIEKWFAFVILSFSMLLVAFNMIGSLWMLVIEKKKDIAILKSMGATSQLVRNIFLAEGLLQAFFGMLIGFGIAVILILLQQNVDLIPFDSPESFVVDAYPTALKFGDFILVGFTVLGIGALAAWLPAWRASKVDGIIRAE